jgi:hypothetical protein
MRFETDGLSFICFLFFLGVNEDITIFVLLHIVKQLIFK